MKSLKKVTFVAAVTLAAFINPTMATEVTVVECDLYPVERYAPHASSTETRAIECVALHAGIRQEQVKVIKIDEELDEVIVIAEFSSSRKTFAVVDKELSL